MAQETVFKFRRIEKKFWMSTAKQELLLPLLEAHLRPDAYGETTVCNVYYDTADFALIRRSIERPFFKEKLRLRSYGVPTEESPVFIELKRKLDGVGYKRRLTLPYADAVELLQGGETASRPTQLTREVTEFLRRYPIAPRVFLAYERRAFCDPAGSDLRVTFDRGLRYRTDPTDMTAGDGGTPFTAAGQVLMEIKTSGAIPLWLAQAMSELKIYQAPYSKIGDCCLRCIAPSVHSNMI